MNADGMPTNTNPAQVTAVMTKKSRGEISCGMMKMKTGVINIKIKILALAFNSNKEPDK